MKPSFLIGGSGQQDDARCVDLVIDVAVIEFDPISPVAVRSRNTPVKKFFRVLKPGQHPLPFSNIGNPRWHFVTFALLRLSSAAAFALERRQQGDGRAKS